jgi:GNAT superfamily N-acetyltransferase
MGQGVRVPWRFSTDVRPYAERVWDLLAADPTANTVALTSIDHVRAGRRWSGLDRLFGWYADDRGVSGAVSMTPPYDLLLAAVPRSSMPELVDALRAHSMPVPGVVGAAATVEEFATLWVAAARAAGGTLRGELGMRQRLYRLDTLCPPATPPGRAELASASDTVLVANWYAAFQREVGGSPVDVEPIARDAVEQGLIWLWRDPVGKAVALAAHTRIVAAVARVGPVYSPPAWRRRGYGAAVTTACTEAALGAGAGGVVLFTDLANPTSNAIYQRLGYLPLHDHQHVRFTAR